MGPARADAADPESDVCANRDSTATAADVGGRVDGWANRDLDIGAFNWSMAEELGSRLDGRDMSDMDLNPSDVWAAMATGFGNILDGWANRDIDIGTF